MNFLHQRPPVHNVPQFTSSVLKKGVSQMPKSNHNDHDQERFSENLWDTAKRAVDFWVSIPLTTLVFVMCWLFIILPVNIARTIWIVFLDIRKK